MVAAVAARFCAEFNAGEPAAAAKEALRTTKWDLSREKLFGELEVADLRAEGALGKRLSQGLACAILNLRFHVGGGDRSVGLARHVIAPSCREADMPISLIGWVWMGAE